MPKYLVIYTTWDGRVSHGLTDNPFGLLAHLIVNGFTTLKAAADARVYLAVPSELVRINKTTLKAAVAAFEEQEASDGQ